MSLLLRVGRVMGRVNNTLSLLRSFREIFGPNVTTRQHVV